MLIFLQLKKPFKKTNAKTQAIKTIASRKQLFENKG
jgi:hypothetical protein